MSINNVAENTPEKHVPAIGEPGVTEEEIDALVEEYGAYISCPQAAKLIGVSAKTLHREIAAKTLEAYRLPGRRTVRVKTADVLRLMKRVA